MKRTKLQKVGLFLSGLMVVWFTIPIIFSGIINIGNVTGIVLFLSAF